MMNPFLTALFLLFPSFVSGILEQTCPTQDISPCKCTKDRMANVTVDCSSAGSAAEISSALTKTSWPSTRLWRFNMGNNSKIVELPQEFFGDLSFQDITMNNTTVKKIPTSALLQSDDTLTDLGILQSRLEDFPFHILQDFRSLKRLYLDKNFLKFVPVFKSDSLEVLGLIDNKITSLEIDGWETPKLKEIYLHKNLLTSVPVIKSYSLELLGLNDNKIRSLDFDARATPKLRELYLDNNLLTFLYGFEGGSLMKLFINVLTENPALRSESLEILSINNNSIPIVRFDGSTTPKLRKLYLNKNLLSSALSLSLSLPNLELLSLKDNILISLDFEAWTIPKLRELYLDNNLLTSAPVFKSDSLEILSINNNNITVVEFNKWATPQLQELYLHHNFLTSVPAFQSKNLELLDLNDNKIMNLEFDGSATPKLRKLNLHNNLLALVPEFKCERLEILDLSDNKITSTVFHGWKTPKLKELYLNKNLLTSVPAFQSDNLELLSLNDNKITSFEFDARATPKLRELYLHRNLLTSVPAFQSDSLELLGLNDNKITSFEFDARDIRKLRELHLENNLLTTFPAFKSDTLERLRLDNNKIADVEEEGWASQNLRDFSIENNPLLKFPSGVIKGLKKLEKFYCSRCNISSILSTGLLEFQSEALELVSLRHNGISRLKQGAITGLRPNTKIRLNENEIAVFSKKSFRPILDILSKGDGVLDLSANGKPSDIGEWPWQAAIYDTRKRLIRCGGALIGKQWVLTAAHCLVEDGTSRGRASRDFRVHLGKYYRDDSLDDEFVQQREVSKIILHEGFHLSNYDSDIALIQLAKPIELTKRVQLICLPTDDYLYLSEANLEDGNRGWVAGWGHNSSNILSAGLTEIEIPVVSNKKCRLDITNTTGKPFAAVKLTWNFFCAGHDKNTSLQDFVPNTSPALS
ncbi:unnamed protein product [Darwinula stevensoni]|uniref:Peptidase S1 domain-containing protein n=1 Tax=Darwinula stevensoni TaxID=69355 RepID=A0A7R8X8H9_9CRUS|nr:unnamed protein product [Darwinula stevensoni]CAG0884491.1 unnamed protein product [Darwinula stevensoni]